MLDEKYLQYLRKICLNNVNNVNLNGKVNCSMKYNRFTFNITVKEKETTLDLDCVLILIFQICNV